MHKPQLKHWHLAYECPDKNINQPKQDDMKDIMGTTCLICLKEVERHYIGNYAQNKYHINKAKRRILELTYNKDFDKLVNED